MARSTNTGKCELCGASATSAEMGRHLGACAPAHDAQGEAGELLLLRFEAAGAPDYWIHVEARADAGLKQIDKLLRDVWLECCDHMSAFYVGREKAGMGAKVGDVFDSETVKLRHEYDFGSTTELQGKLVGTRRGPLGRKPVRLVARNDPLPWTCETCEAPATVVCPFCEGVAVFCDAHAESHTHAEEEMYLPVVNSPRMGVCGYTG